VVARPLGAGLPAGGRLHRQGEEIPMGDKSPKRTAEKKVGKSIKEKRAEKKAKHPNAPPPIVPAHKR
jgi:hypothetical protein